MQNNIPNEIKIFSKQVIKNNVLFKKNNDIFPLKNKDDKTNLKILRIRCLLNNFFLII